MTPRVLLDTHIVVRWLVNPKRLSRDQTRILTEAVRRRETVAISGITLIEMAILLGDGRLRTKLSMDEVFSELEASPVFRILPLTIDIAKEVSFLRVLRDPADRVIVATARVHGLRLLTSDRRIIESDVVSAVE
ncbi:MAG: type II toxin-antitoxin system VapC family toxin [Bryobacteraceae bacterium]